MKKQLLTLALLTAFSNAALAGDDCTTVVGNLIDNCSFEDVGTATAGFFGTKGGVDDGTGPQSGWLFDANASGEALPDWADASGSVSPEYYAEVRDDTRGIGTAYSGTKFLELDTEAYLGGISQDVTLTGGYLYTLSFYYSKRVNTGSTPQEFRASLGTTTEDFDGVDTGHDLITGDHVWTLEELVFTPTTTGTYTVSFLDLGDLNSEGASIDNIVLTGVAAVPEPETYAMFLMGLGLLGFAARKQKS